MRSLHYPIGLPADYDMHRIEQRVRELAGAFDTVRGLALKAFLTTSIAQGDAVNSYAPFYVWNDAGVVTEFLTGPLFGGVVSSFGRPAVFDRAVLAFDTAAHAPLPKFAVFEEIALDAQRPFGEVRAAETRWLRATLAWPGAFAAAAVVDTATWVLTRVLLTVDAAAAPAGARRYDVLKVIGDAARPRPSLARFNS